ncbi:hypothetical protein [Cryptosporangium minutisporangium]|uniref:DUF397 domain-containing protein n=1 Tax=Cryptosporangium minutisporangium TaxID=113569 RepID=A0ABP6T157_9ACTN
MYIAYLAKDGQPVFVSQTEKVHVGRITKKKTTSFDVGPSAADTRRFEGTVTTGRFF